MRDCGPSNCPSPEPDEPNEWANVPLYQNNWMRSLPVSATPITELQSTYTSPGPSNCPSPEPDEPNKRTNVPLGQKTCTRSLPVSATYN